MTFAAAVVIAYIIAARIGLWDHHLAPDRMMILADRIAIGRLDAPEFARTVDSVEIAGRYYIAVGPLQVIPYLPFVPFPALQRFAPLVTGLAVGIAAALVQPALARAYGARYVYWIASLSAFGTVLFYVSVARDFYYLAHAESFLALSLMLIEWTGRRRGWVLGLLLGISFMARSPTILAAIPFGLALLLERRPDPRALVTFAAPLLVAVLAIGVFDWARFGSPLETGYAISFVNERSLAARRALGVFSIAQVPENVRLALFALPSLRRTLPVIVPDRHGMTMALVSPGLAIAARAGIRDPGTWPLWGSVLLVAVPIFLYYGGGYVQYGFRYSLDFTPFLLALGAMGTARGFGWIDRLLIVFSAISVAFGIYWHALPPIV